MFYFIMGLGIGAHAYAQNYWWVALLLFLLVMGMWEDYYNDNMGQR